MSLASAKSERARSLRALLPPGPVWDLDPDLDAECRGLSTDGARVQLDLEQLVSDYFPDTSVAFLDDWERILQLTPGNLDAAGRQRQTLAKLRGYGDPSLPNVQAIADSFALHAVIENRPYALFVVGTSTMGEELRGDDWVSTIRITYDGPVQAFEDAITAALPLHVTPEFVYR